MKVDGQAGQDAGSFPLPNRLSVSRSMPLAEVCLGCCGMELEFGCVSYHDQFGPKLTILGSWNRAQIPGE